MSFECNDCHTIATGKTGFDVHYRPISRGRCETCGRTADCFQCQCSGDWAKARHAANPPAEGRVPNDRPTRHAMWRERVQPGNTLAESLATVMAEGRYDEPYEDGPEFHYAVYGALQARDSDQALRYILDSFAQLQRSHRKLIDAQTLALKIAPAPTIIIKTVDEPQSS